MKLSARNVIASKVLAVEEGAVNAHIVLEAGSNKLSSTITLEATKELGLEEGKEVYAIIKSSNVIVAKGSKVEGISARNQLAGKVESVDEGAVSAVVRIKLEGGEVISSDISLQSAKDLGLEDGTEVVAIIKSTDVIVGIA